MRDLNKKVYIKIAAVLICLVMVISAVVFFRVKNSGSNDMVAEDVKVSAVDISQTVTAAGEIVTAEEEKISFSTSKVFSAMCAEEGERVTKGQHLIMYRNGTYEDAPGDGFVTYVNAPATGTTADSSDYLVFAYEDKLRLDITVPEGEINKVHKGDKAEITADADTSKQYEGKITSIKAISTTQLESDESSSSESIPAGGSGNSKSPFGSESSTAYYTVSVSLDNDGRLLPGMSAICTITIDEKKDVIAVPIEAVRYTSGGKAYVATVSGDKTDRAYVKTGISDSEYVEIKEGLTGGETVRIERKEYAG